LALLASGVTMPLRIQTHTHLLRHRVAMLVQRAYPVSPHASQDNKHHCTQHCKRSCAHASRRHGVMAKQVYDTPYGHGCNRGSQPKKIDVMTYLMHALEGLFARFREAPACERACVTSLQTHWTQQAYLLVRCCRDNIAIPNVLALVDPSTLIPHVVVVASLIAAGPVLVLLITRAAFSEATCGRLAILAVSRTSNFVCIFL